MHINIYAATYAVGPHTDVGQYMEIGLHTLNVMDIIGLYLSIYTHLPTQISTCLSVWLCVCVRVCVCASICHMRIHTYRLPN